jgi:hypothetical protein
MSGTAHEAKGKLEALARLFPEHVNGEFVERLDPNKINWGRASKSQFLGLIAAAPSADQRRVISDTYKAIFKEEGWLTRDVEAAATSSPAPRMRTISTSSPDTPD